MSHVVYLGLGSNLNEPLEQLKQATTAIAALAGVRLLQSSSSYRNPPLTSAVVEAGLVFAHNGRPQGEPLQHPHAAQPDYVNKVLAIATTLSPDDLLTKLQVIEIEQGRPREHGHWTPRTIDIDILLYDDYIINTSQLTIPHPGLTSSVFVVLPLLEIAPDLRLPNGELLSRYGDKFKNESVTWVKL